MGALIAGTSPAAKGEATSKAKAPSAPSTVESPVAFVHATCDKMKDAARKDVIAALVAKGVNKFTAATQYQAWRKAHAK